MTSLPETEQLRTPQFKKYSEPFKVAFFVCNANCFTKV